MTEDIDKPADSGRLLAGSILATRAANIIRYSLMNIFILAGTVGIAFGGFATWTGLLLSFILIGFVDELFGDAGPKETMPPVWYMQLQLYLTLPLLIFLTLVCFNVISETGIGFMDTVFRFFGFDPEAARVPTGDHRNGALVSTGMFYGAAGVNVAHELIHRTDKKWDHLVGRWLLAFTWDTGFSIEHVYGHHKNVGTELDPATARRGEYIWAFVFRSTVGQWISGLRFENERLKRRGIPNTPWNNRFWRGQMMTLAILGFYCFFLGWLWGPISFIYTGMLGKIYLELVNYIEHYGLVRIPGTRVEHRHSWDSYRRVTSGMFYNLMLHSNHHKIATRRYWELEQAPNEAPLYPLGYMATIFIAFVPYFWKKYSEPLLADWDRRLASPEEREYLKQKGLLRG